MSFLLRLLLAQNLVHMAVCPAMERYLASIARYKRSMHPRLDEQTRERIAQAWGRNFDEWGYER